MERICATLREEKVALRIDRQFHRAELVAGKLYLPEPCLRYIDPIPMPWREQKREVWVPRWRRSRYSCEPNVLSGIKL